MSPRSALLIALGVSLSATTALLAAEPPATPEKERLICRGGEKQLSSRIRTERRCRTAERWQQEDEEKANNPVSLQTTEGQMDGRPVRPPG